MPIALSHIKYRQNFLTNLTIAELVIHDRSNVYLIADTQADIGLSFKVPLQANFYIGNIKSRHDFYPICPKIF